MRRLRMLKSFCDIRPLKRSIFSIRPNWQSRSEGIISEAKKKQTEENNHTVHVVFLCSSGYTFLICIWDQFLLQTS